MDGGRLAYYRKKAHMTQAEVARIIGIRSETLSLYELKKKTPRVDTIKALADLYGCGIEELTGYTARMYRDYDNYAKTLRKLEKAEKVIAKILKSEYGELCQFCAYGEDKTAGCWKVSGSGQWCSENAYWKGTEE